MGRNSSRFARQYQSALRKHLRQGSRASLRSTQNLGRQAMQLGLETLDLVRIHEQVLVRLEQPSDSPADRSLMVRRAGTFFAAVITPIEELHRTAVEANSRLEKLTRALCRRTMELAASNKRLKAETEQRRVAEESFKKSEQHYAHLLEQSRQMQDQLRLLSRQLLSAQEEERKKISRELHDVIAQTLTSINVRLAALRKEATLNTKDIERSIERTQKLVKHSVDIVHRFARELRPTVLDDLGLIPALHSYMKSFQADTGIRVSLSAPAAVERVNGDKRTALYRVALEALANVARHSHATHAEVKFVTQDGVVAMSIRDNGKGFQPELEARAKRVKRLGLLGMKERVDMVGGNFNVDSTAGKGTTVRAQIPLMDNRSLGGGWRR